MQFLKKTIQILLLFALFTATACKEEYPDLKDGLYAEIVTNMGTMVIELDYVNAPITVANFVSLAEGTNTLVDSAYLGKKYYNGLTFHRIIKDFMIQGGDPTGTGSGNPGYKFNNEISENLKHDKAGTISMANSGPNTNGSQFFITDKETPFLDGGYNVFGYIAQGETVLHEIASVPTGKDGMEKDRPLKPVEMTEINIIRKGSDAKAFDAPKVFKNHFVDAEKAQKILEQQMEEKIREMEEKSSAAAADMKPALESYEGKAKALSSGLKLYTITAGTGDKPKLNDEVNLFYQGYFTDGQLFDSNVRDVEERYGMLNEQKDQRGMYAPMPMPINPNAQMIPGFKDAVNTMRVGDKVFAYLPSHLAYGDRGSGRIEPNTDLIFIIEMVSITKD